MLTPVQRDSKVLFGAPNRVEIAAAIADRPTSRVLVSDLRAALPHVGQTVISKNLAKFVDARILEGEEGEYVRLKSDYWAAAKRMLAELERRHRPADLRAEREARRGR